MWGVPIPAFKCNSCSAVFTDASLIRRIAELTRKKGSNIWFSASVEDLLPEGAVCRECGSSDLLKENDILDVWFDSGVSHKAVLDARQDLSSPADMYLEGSDQHRGWFQSSLITSVAMNGDAPYREVLTHGFVVDGEGKKMSKSLGNVISPLDVMRKYGADILRLWTASSDYEGDIKLSEEILQRLADGYRKIRNTFRFLLSNLNDFEPGAHVQDHGDLSETDRWMLAGLYSLVEKVTEAYESRQYHKVYRAVYGFCVEQISSFYLDVSKDILYVDAPGSTRRRSVQTVLYYLLDTLCRLMAPVMPFTMEEVWSHLSMSEKCPSVHMADWPDMEALKEKWGDDGLRASWARLLSLREKIMKSLETKREEGLIGSSLDARLCFFAEDPEIRSYIDRFLDRIPLLFKVSQAEIKEVCAPGMEDVGDFPLKLGVEKARGEKCQRCWNYSQTVGDFAEYEDLCERCFNIVAERSGNG
jgi:isoleucyl-tRNA synthetase